MKRQITEMKQTVYDLLYTLVQMERKMQSKNKTPMHIRCKKGLQSNGVLHEMRKWTQDP